MYVFPHIHHSRIIYVWARRSKRREKGKQKVKILNAHRDINYGACGQDELGELFHLKSIMRSSSTLTRVFAGCQNISMPDLFRVVEESFEKIF